MKLKRRLHHNALPLAGVGVLAVAALAVAGVALASPTSPPPASSAASSYLATPHVAPDPKVFVVIGDSYTGGSNMGGDRGTPNNWVVAAGNKLRAGTDDDVVPVERGVGGSGYVNRGPNRSKVFGETAAESLHPETDVAVFFGSINDQAQPLDKVRAAADKTFTRAEKDAPNAKFIVIGPAWMRPDVPDEIYAIRDMLSTLAAKHKFEFIDPLAEEWFQNRPELIGSDGTHPTNAGHLLMAEKITPHLKAALAKQ